MRFLFRKNEKITSEKEIALIFTDGVTNFIHPIKVLFLLNTNPTSECKVLITVSKRYLKNASDRNMVKRRLREAYRLNSLNFKSRLVEKNTSASIAFIYTSSKIVAYKKIEEIVKRHLSIIINIIEKGEGNN
jgi:ribonuclease P protein component